MICVIKVMDSDGVWTVMGVDEVIALTKPQKVQSEPSEQSE